MLEQARQIIADFGLLSFSDCSLAMLDVSLRTSFVERWYKEASSFHLPFGEMTITLDDVSSLFHLPIAGRFFIAPVITQKLACIVATWDLGVIEA